MSPESLICKIISFFIEHEPKDQIPAKNLLRDRVSLCFLRDTRELDNCFHF